MTPRILDQVTAVVADAIKSRPMAFTWMDNPIDHDSFTDLQGFLPLLTAVAANVSNDLGVLPPSLVLSPDDDSSFRFKLESLRVDPRFGLAPFLLVLRDSVLEMAPAIEVYRDAIDDYLFRASIPPAARARPLPVASEQRAARAE